MMIPIFTCRNGARFRSLVCPIPKPDHGAQVYLLLVHGYGAPEDRILSAYDKQVGSLEASISRADGDYGVAGFLWPTLGNVAGYFYDLSHANNKRTADALAQSVRFIYEHFGAEKVIILAHSMGTILALNYQRLHCNYSDLDAELILLGGDALQKQLRPEGDFGGGRGFVFYSMSDPVVGVVARIARPGARIGAFPLQPPIDAERFLNFDANQAHRDGFVLHNTYKSSPGIGKEVLRLAGITA